MSQWLSPGPPNQYIPPPPYRPPQNQAPPIDDLSLAFDKLAMALRATAGPPEIDNFQMSLGMLMHDCSQSNIQRGKTWIFDHCTTPAHYDTLISFIIALSKSRPIFEDRLHLIYLINDVLFHSERRQEPWIKEALHPHLLALLRVAFHFMDANEKQKEKVVKIISIWDDKQYFDENKINALRTGIKIPPPPSSGISSVSYSTPGQHPFHFRYQNQPYYSPGVPPPPPPPPGIFPGPPPSQSISPSNPHLSPSSAQGLIRPISEPGPPGIQDQFPPGQSPSNMPIQGMIRPPVSTTPNMPPIPPPVSEKKYHELPAGLMVPAVLPEDSPYTSIHAASIRLPPHRLPPTTELLEAVDRFYEGMFIIESNLEGEDERALREKYQIDLDKDGWEIGFLDDFYMDLQEQREEAARASSERYHHRHSSSFRHRRDDRGRRWSRDRTEVVVIQEVAGDIDVEETVEVIVVVVRDPGLDDIGAIVVQDIVGGGGLDLFLLGQEHAQELVQGVFLDRFLDLVQEPVHLREPEQGQDRGLAQKLERELYQDLQLDSGLDRGPFRQDIVLNLDQEVEQGLDRYVKDREEGSRPDKMISDRNVGFQILKKLGWEGAGTGLGSSSSGIAEPIKGGEIRYGEQKYLGVGHSRGDDGDIFDQYRKAKSYTYQRSEISSKDKKLAGCFRCGKPGHLARDCPNN
ncbi:hypothetical protein GLOIN_2v1774128 [Rhizophagus irregularis DAOM 181602=DAOM 197198]|uniref:Uncharacterized protein n=1 Tax=Rhizophagus irregularis (strain DAOM 181602 / DAOM 197198 / MUCL 43194) TaxID=747089 RepID=A0A2P4Q328_RHIID|nr:hypothetical protein GLOIN_2v1774128 [Rhizophagus irregularis DAOM 181602=DAOM 197198]POG72071.1 hypothetical protein GLOIN_2v1774128 [Rhizophagus irregularis DAOM 181602=DAOM 197198]|eukprot:XP_025178937.1 hypothetical protein GLOIN_2v1774128 [Rhizophagus irregularis DAOM 181602=DAOM 197198]